MSEKTCTVYILTNKNNSTLYIGVTSDMQKRIIEHREKINPKSFTARYNLSKLVYCETTDDIQAAIHREKQLKNWKRVWKIELIEKKNPEWKDLSEDWET